MKLKKLLLYGFLYEGIKKYLKKMRFPNNVVELPAKCSRIKISIAGKNNEIKIADFAGGGVLSLSVVGDNNKIEISGGLRVSGRCDIRVGNGARNFTPCHGAEIKIGKNLSMESGTIAAFNSGSKLEIGSDCMFAGDVCLMHTDAHPIFDESGAICNYVSKMKIGNKVWLCDRCVILKNSVIADGCIVGFGAVCDGEYGERNCLIAGNPAKAIKKNILWSKYSRDFAKNGHVKNPTILTIDETVKQLKAGKSIARFGDGEFGAFVGKDLIFQKVTPEFTRRLKQVFDSCDDSFLIGINRFYWYEKDTDNPPSGLGDSSELGGWAYNYLCDNLSRIESYLNPGKTYASAEFSCMGYMHPDSITPDYYKKIQSIWENKDIAVIEGAGLHNNRKFDIFANAKSVEWIDAPRRNAFNVYDEVLGRAKKIDKKKLVLIILGPTSDILAYDLFNSGYQAIDLGHTAKDYDVFMSDVSRPPVHEFYGAE